jgi:PAS domain-containing protein
MLGYTSEEMKSLNAADIHPRDKLPFVFSMLEEIYKGERDSAFNVPCLRKDGKEFNVDIKGITAIIDGVPCGVAFFRDITDREKAEAAIYKANASLEARVSQTSEISKALITDIGIERATGIIYESGWKIGLETAKQAISNWDGDTKSVAEEFFEHHAAALAMQVTIAEFDESTYHARIRLFPGDTILDDIGNTDAELAYAQGFIAAVLSISFKKPMGLRKAAPNASCYGMACHILETRELEPYEIAAYRLE